MLTTYLSNQSLIMPPQCGHHIHIVILTNLKLFKTKRHTLLSQIAEEQVVYQLLNIPLI